MDQLFDAIGGLAIEVSGHMVGAKTAVKIGSKIVVSPAMYKLISTANEEELKQLLAAIPVIDIPKPPSIFGPITFPISRDKLNG